MDNYLALFIAASVLVLAFVEVPPRVRFTCGLIVLALAAALFFWSWT